VEQVLRDRRREKAVTGTTKTEKRIKKMAAASLCGTGCNPKLHKLLAATGYLTLVARSLRMSPSYVDNLSPLDKVEETVEHACREHVGRDAAKRIRTGAQNMLNAKAAFTQRSRLGKTVRGMAFNACCEISWQTAGHIGTETHIALCGSSHLVPESVMNRLRWDHLDPAIRRAT
jgi:hypothetical protein